LQRPASSLYLGTICNSIGNKNARASCTASFDNKVPKHIRFGEEMPMTVTSKAWKFIMRERMVEELN